MFSAVILSTVILSLKFCETAAYGYDSFTGPQQHKPVFATSPVANLGGPESLPSGDSDFSFNENVSWKRDLFYSRRPAIHGPQVENDASNFRPAGQTQPLDGNGGGFARPWLQNSAGRRRQLGSAVNSGPNPFLFPAADDPDDIFIFDRPTSINPRPITTPSPIRTTTARNCDCPSTPEFNPVCGSDGITYNNPGKLKCAIFCGTVVSLKHRGTCFATTTSAPTPSPLQ